MRGPGTKAWSIASRSAMDSSPPSPRERTAVGRWATRGIGRQPPVARPPRREKADVEQARVDRRAANKVVRRMKTALGAVAGEADDRTQVRVQINVIRQAGVVDGAHIR